MYVNPPGRAVRIGMAHDVLSDRENTAFPFLYTLVPKSQDMWESEKFSVTGDVVRNMSGIGPYVLPLQTVDHAVILDTDFNFKLLWIRYTVYILREPGATPPYDWYLDVADGTSSGYDYQRRVGYAGTRCLRVGLTVTGPDGRYLYGAPSVYPTVNTVAGEHPILPSSMQGYEYGLGEVNTEYLFPAGAMMRFRFTNMLPAGRNNYKMFVGALIYGMKVRI